MKQVYDIYNQFLSIFPHGMQWVVSIVLAVLLVYAIFKILKKNFIFIIVLVILLPASVPILMNIWQNLVILVKFLLTKR